MVLSTILLMSTPAYHRIVEHGEETEAVYSFASRMLLFAMVLLPVGIAGDFYIVVTKIIPSNAWASISAVLILLFFYGLWFGYMAYRKQKSSG
jgi:uncharacterized membrane protein YqjE